MTGGEIRVARYVAVPGSSLGSGHIKLYGDSILRVGVQLLRGSAGYTRIDIGGGQLIFPGDMRQHAANWIGPDYIVAYDDHPRASLTVIYDETADETIVTSSIPDVNKAYDPSPANGANVVRSELNELSWMPGDSATEHHIYFGLDEAAVDAADISDTSGIYRGTQPLSETSYDLAEQLELGEVYYWRIDESDGETVWKGDVWSFTLADYLLIDDMDSYQSATEQWQISGSGSLALDTDLVRSSPQSLEVSYWGSDVVVSREFATAQDWTVENVAAIFTALKGTNFNAYTEVKLRLEDASANSAEVFYDDPNALTDDEDYLGWNHWNASLGDFTGVDMQNVKKISYILPNAAAGVGTIYIEDIRLYIPRCLPSMATYPGDISGDCLVDLNDYVMLALDWLKADKQSSGLVGDWKFDEGSGDAAADSSGLGNDGVLVNNPTWSTGHLGGALDFDASGEAMVVPVSDSISVGRGDFTLSAWILTRSLYSVSSPGVIFAKVKDGFEKEYMFSIVLGRLRLDMENGGDNGYAQTAENVVSEYSWEHVALVFDASALSPTFYIDGSPVATVSNAILNLPRYTDDDLYIGCGSGAYSGWNFDGRIENPRIYDQALSAAQIADLAADTDPTLSPVLRPLVSDADVNDDGIVNDDDLKQLAASWLQDEYLWPTVN
jgi:hypothetical protein